MFTSKVFGHWIGVALWGQWATRSWIGKVWKMTYLTHHEFRIMFTSHSSWLIAKQCSFFPKTLPTWDPEGLLPCWGWFWGDPDNRSDEIIQVLTNLSRSGAFGEWNGIFLIASLARVQPQKERPKIRMFQASEGETQYRGCEAGCPWTQFWEVGRDQGSSTKIKRAERVCKFYPSSHNHGSGKWMHLKGNYYWREPFFTSMIVRKGRLWLRF